MVYFRNRPPIRNARTSLQHQARLSLVAEVPSPQSDVARRQSTLPEGNNPIGQAMTTRTNSDHALYAPIRRRSLLAHGVATRASYVEPDPPRSVPPQANLPQDMQNYYYNPSKPTSSPLSDLTMIAPNPAFATDGPRAETPTEFHYGHLGGFNGTLRITNGAASPVPSSHRRSNSLGAEEDYFEARNSVESSHRHNLSQRSNTISVQADAIRSPWIVRSESPLRNSHDAQFKPLTIQTQIPQDSLFSASNFEEERKLFKRTESPTKAQELANEYMQDLALSPFSFETSPLPSPQFQVTSKHTAMEDDLFEPEPDSPRRSADLENRIPRSFDSGYVGGEPSPPAEEVKQPREAAPKPLAKADSGYSSNVSLRSFKKDPSPAKEPTLRPPKEPVSRVASSTYSVESEATVTAKDSTPVQEIPELPRRLPPPVPVKESSFNVNGALRNNQPPPVPHMRVGHAYSAPPQSHAAAKTSQNRPQQHNTLPVPDSSVREESPVNSDITPSSNSSSRWRPKLTKRESQQSQHRIQTDQVFTVQAIRSPSEAYRIPPPSVEARRRLGEREEAFPVQSFPNTIAGNVALRRMSIDTLGTIFSVGSMEVSDEPNFARHQGNIPPMPPMPTITQEPVQQPRPKENRRNTFQAPARYPPQPARHGRQSFSPVSRERGPSPSQMANWGRRAMLSMPHDVPRPVQDFETHVTSMENISSSLGRSGYDAARPDPVDQRAKSMTAQFEADAAARFAASKQRNVSASSDASTVIGPRKSYDSIANGNPYASGSGPSTANNSRNNSSEYHPMVQNSARRSSYTNLANLPSQSSLLSAPPTTSTSPIEKRTSRPPTSKSPPPVSMATRAQSISRKPVGQPQPTRQAPVPQAPRHATPQVSPNKKLPLSPLAQQHDPSTWGAAHERKKSQASLGTRKSFDSARTPTTYEVVTLEEYKKRASGPSPRASIGDLTRPTSTTTSSKPSTKDKKSKRERGEDLKRRKSAAVEEIPRIVYHAPTVRERKSLEVPRINVQAYGAPVPTPMQQRPRNRLSQSQSQEALTLRDLQREELQKRRPKSVQPSEQVRKEVKEEGKRGRWDAYTAIFGSGSGSGKENRERVVSKERISRPRAVAAEDLAYGTPVVRRTERVGGAGGGGGGEYYSSPNERAEEIWRPEQMRRVSSSTQDMLALHANVGYGSVRVHG
jgi:hypothetical protein